jgi:hypothetical protein
MQSAIVTPVLHDTQHPPPPGYRAWDKAFHVAFWQWIHYRGPQQLAHWMLHQPSGCLSLRERQLHISKLAQPCSGTDLSRTW